MKKRKAMYKLVDIINILKFGLENRDKFGDSEKKIQLKDLKVLNENTLCCLFYPYSTNSIDVKVEIGAIMGFFSGFFKGDEFDGVSFAYYAVRAFDKSDKEILYAISSKDTAELIGKGNSIDWLKSTIFQENTDDYRLSQAKRIISEIENSLREIVKKVLNSNFGHDWWNKALDNKLGDAVKKTYLEQFGVEDADGDILINYTYTLQLKKIISTHWKLFKKYFDTPTTFEKQMDELNIIRREEAHNRFISDDYLEKLKLLHEKLLSKACTDIDSLESVYLVENWKMKIKKIMSEKYEPIYGENEVVDETNMIVKLIKSKNTIKNTIEYLDDKITKLESVTTPVQKINTHKQLITIFSTFRALQSELLENSEELDENKINSTIARIAEHKKVMDGFLNNFLLTEN